MRGALVTFRREMLSYVVSPVSWLIAVVFYLWRGFELSTRIAGLAYYRQDEQLLAPTSYGLPSTMVMVILVPGILTMRSFAEERRSGSLETLLTAPVRDIEVVLGKWAAAAVFYSLLWLPSVVILHLLEYGTFLAMDLSFGPVFAAYLGMFLLSGMLLAFGCFASSLTDNLLLAALLAIKFNLALIYVSSLLTAALGDTARNFYVRELLDKLNVMGNFSEWFARGLIDTSQIVFYLGGIGVFLGLTCVSLASRRIA